MPDALPRDPGGRLATSPRNGAPPCRPRGSRGAVGRGLRYRCGPPAIRFLPCASSASKPPATKPASPSTTPSAGLLAHALHSQVAMHEAYGGVVPELASRDHVRRVVPLAQQVLAEAGLGARRPRRHRLHAGAGARRRAAGRRERRQRAGLRARQAGGRRPPPRRATCCRRCWPIRGPRFRSSRCWSRAGTRQLFEVAGVGRYRLLGDTLDDAAGEAFDKTAKLLGLRLSRRAGARAAGRRRARRRRRAAAADARQRRPRHELLRAQDRGADARAARGRGRNRSTTRARPTSRASSRHAVVDVLVGEGAGGARRDRARAAGRRRRRRRQPRAARAARRARSRERGGEVFFPDLEFCTDNGAMIALAGALRLASTPRRATARSRCGRAGTWRRWQPSADARDAGRLSARSCVSLPSSSCRMLARCRQNSSSAIGTIAQAVERVAEHVERAERHQHGGGERGERQILKPKRHHQPQHGEREAERPVQREHDAGAGRHALAACEAVEHREQVAEEHRERGRGHRPRRRRRVRRPSCCASQTASQPLTPSPTSVSAAAALLPVRSTLVAPGLPEP